MNKQSSKEAIEFWENQKKVAKEEREENRRRRDTCSCGSLHTECGYYKTL